MKISIITLFPEDLKPILNSSILGRAQKKGLLEFELIDLRKFGEGPHQTVDDRPYGGGVGMILKAGVLAKALEKLNPKGSKPKVILTSAGGIPYKQAKAREFSKLEDLVIICGHYEGVDQRFVEKYVDEEISIGDYVLTGGEIPALVLAGSIARLIPGVLEKEEATLEESFENGLLEYPQFTRPETFEGSKVPDVLLSGNHQEIKKWREKTAKERTEKLRPDLLKRI